jgi:hypothetical protein
LLERTFDGSRLRRVQLDRRVDFSLACAIADRVIEIVAKRAHSLRRRAHKLFAVLHRASISALRVCRCPSTMQGLSEDVAASTSFWTGRREPARSVRGVATLFTGGAAILGYIVLAFAMPPPRTFTLDDYREQ